MGILASAGLDEIRSDALCRTAESLYCAIKGDAVVIDNIDFGADNVRVVCWCCSFCYLCCSVKHGSNVSPFESHVIENVRF